MKNRLEIRLVTALALAAPAVACTHDSSLDGRAEGAPDTDGEEPEGPPGPCDGLAWLAGSEEVAATPREDELAEWLALSVSTGITASEAVYVRASEDLEAILASDATLPRAYTIGHHDTSTFTLVTDASTEEAMLDGSYGAWDCHNEHYGVERIWSSSYTPGVWVEFEGRYDMNLLSVEYRYLPGVTEIRMNGYLSDGGGPSTIRLTIEGTTYHYVFLDARDHSDPSWSRFIYTYYRTTRAGEPIFGGSWRWGEPEPDWLGTYWYL